MNTQASYLHKLRYFFYILMAAIFGWFLFMELFGPDEQSANRTSTAALYSGTFVWEKADGTSEEIKVPGKYRVPAGEPRCPHATDRCRSEVPKFREIRPGRFAACHLLEEEVKTNG